ncbi:MAG: SDR family oxidoreductase [Bacteroidetes bacterium]|nr:SDR family oxidoreductase [Bacteroidota bacterium]MBS1973945.1 SDR family oxidoreductase [Bacteroidota bacterium]
MNIFLTGSTGFLGGEILVGLAKRKEVDKIYCFIRPSNEQDALARLKKVFAVHNDYFEADKVIPISGNLFDPHLTASLQANNMLDDTDVIIHSAANTSFSRIYDDILEQVNIAGLEKLLLWAKQLPRLKTFLYVGTATICGTKITHRLVREDESPNEDASHLVRYTYTKMQGELMVDKHIAPEKVLIARPSIIMGDSKHAMPRSPVILWAVATINHLRLIPVNDQAMLDMIPVDYAANAIVELMLAKRKHKVYHISSGQDGATSAHKLSISLSEYFNGLPPFKFIDKSFLNQIKLWAKNRLKPESKLYEYQAYLDYWNEEFTDPGAARILLAGLEPYLEFMELGQAFDNSRLLSDVLSIKQPLPAEEYIRNCMGYIAKINILEGALDP